jgi:septum formation protein
MNRRSIILASGSPRRRSLIQLLDHPWYSQVADVDELSVTDPNPARNVVETAALKAQAVARHAPADTIIVAADTTVAIDGHMLNKPADDLEAKAMLQQLRGRVHQVHTGIVIIDQSSGRVVHDVATVDVPMRHYSEEEIDAYVATGDPLDKAGAYAIQHREFEPVARLTGCYAAVVGLPLCHLTRALRDLGTQISNDVASRCQAHHAYDCPIYNQILGSDGAKAQNMPK